MISVFNIINTVNLPLPSPWLDKIIGNVSFPFQSSFQWAFLPSFQRIGTFISDRDTDRSKYKLLVTFIFIGPHQDFHRDKSRSVPITVLNTVPMQINVINNLYLERSVSRTLSRSLSDPCFRSLIRIFKELSCLYSSRWRGRKIYLL